jgi:hypothetical protein
VSRSTVIEQGLVERIDDALERGLDESDVFESKERGQTHAIGEPPLARALREAVRTNRRVKRWAEGGPLAPSGLREMAQNLNQKDGEPVTALVEQEVAQARVAILQRWDGVVLDVGDKTFRARLLDESSGRPQIDADVFISEVPPHDQEMLRPGAVFYWHIGYRDPTGDRERVSRIRFRRLPPKTKADLRRAERRAASLRSQLGWNE